MGHGERVNRTGGMVVPESCLALAALCISPLMLGLHFVDSVLAILIVWYAATPMMLAFTLAYLVLIAPGGLAELTQTRPLGRCGKAYATYFVAVVVYGVVFLSTMTMEGLIPFLLLFGFAPFQAVSVLVLTISASREVGRRTGGLRLSLAVLLLLFSVSWPVVLMSFLP